MYHHSVSFSYRSLRLFLCGLIGLFFSQSAVVAEVAESWTQWRGPNRDGQIEKSEWPNSLSDNALKELWSTELAEGYASPVLTTDLVFSVETRDKKEEVVRAFDRNTGKQQWEFATNGAMKVPFYAARNGSWARSTPATDGDYLYVLSMVDVLTRLDVKTGKEMWQVDFKERERTQTPPFGGISSPLVEGDYVYVQGGHAAAKLDRATSENEWRVMEERQGMFAGSFSSPVMAEIHGIRQFVVQTRSTLGGIDPESGEILWSTPVEASRGMNILTPLVSGNRIFTSTYEGGSFCFEIEQSGGKQSATLHWRLPKVEGYMTSPVIVDGYIYHQARDKQLYCINLSTGAVQWISEQDFGQYWSMVVNGNQILALDERGYLLLFEANPDGFQITDQRKVSQEPTWAHLAVSGNQIFIRGLKTMTAYSWNEN
jgi:outer membrane protein assembly factor BamB